jgi:hypothetical protein
MSSELKLQIEDLENLANDILNQVTHLKLYESLLISNPDKEDYQVRAIIKLIKSRLELLLEGKERVKKRTATKSKKSLEISTTNIANNDSK